MNKTTAEQVHEFLRESNAIEREYSEQSFDDSLHAWNYLMTQSEMTIDVVKEVHRILMATRPLEEKYKGEFRDIPVYIGRHEAMNCKFIEPSLQSWCSGMNMRGTEGLENKEGLSRDLHVEYEHIHPFVDGNGRTGRMFMNWERLHNDLPLLIIHEGDEQMEYYKWFRK